MKKILFTIIITGLLIVVGLSIGTTQISARNCNLNGHNPNCVVPTLTPTPTIIPSCPGQPC